MPELVLQEADLPAVWAPFDVGRQTSAEAGDPQRFGREGGWKARFRRPGSLNTPGALVIDSRADLFGSEDGAEENLGAIRQRLGELVPGARRVAPPALGEEALAATYVEAGADRAVRFYFVAWRAANVTGSILVSGFDGRLTLAQVLTLARKQERRIAAAAG